MSMKSEHETGEIDAAYDPPLFCTKSRLRAGSPASSGPPGSMISR